MGSEVISTEVRNEIKRRLSNRVNVCREAVLLIKEYAVEEIWGDDGRSELNEYMASEIIAMAIESYTEGIKV